MTKIILTFLIGLLTLISCNKSTTTNHEQKKKQINIKELSDKYQILLTNQANFKNHTSLNGASAFLINYKNETYAVTAKHLIGEDGGVEPEIKPNELATAINDWHLFPRVNNKISNDTIKIQKSPSNYDSTSADLLLLKTNNYKGSILALTPNFDLPKENDSLYVIGCPYSEENCRQNLYSGVFTYYDFETKSIICTLNNKIQLPGFSGAPMIDSQGKVVAILTTGWEENGKYYVGGTCISEIKKIK